MFNEPYDDVLTENNCNLNKLASVNETKWSQDYTVPSSDEAYHMTEKRKHLLSFLNQNTPNKSCKRMNDNYQTL